MRVNLNYADLDSGVFSYENRFIHILQQKKNLFVKENFPRLRGSELTLEYVRKTGLKEPVFLNSAEGSGMIMPSPSFSVDNVVEILGLLLLLLFCVFLFGGPRPIHISTFTFKGAT